MQRKLYIHIGNHKTGTTSIQRALEENTTLLEKHDMSLFHVGEFLTLNRKQCRSIICMNIKNVNLLAFKLSKLPTNNILISNESFAWIFEKKVLEELYNALSEYFKEIKIIVYLRRQDEQAVSHHQEASKSGKNPEILLYGTEPYAIPTYANQHDYYLDYHKRISLWADVFGDDNMIVKVFEKSNLQDNDVVSDFFSILNLPKPKKSIYRLNESNSLAKTKISHLLNAHMGNSYLRRYISEHLYNEGKPMLPSKDNARKYYDHFRKNNKKLEERFGVKFNENFEKYPDVEEDIWDDESANLAIAQLLTAIDDYDKNRIKIFIKRMRQKIIKLASKFFLKRS